MSQAITKPTKQYTLADAERLNPTRSARWRYERIRRLLGEGGRQRKRPDKTRDDEWVRAAYDFVRRWNRIDEIKDIDDRDEARLRLFPEYPGLYYAHKLYTEQPNQLARIALEARILARQDDEKISQAMSMIPEVVPWYEAIYFNVRDKLDNADYIVRTVLGPVIGIGLRNSTEELACKYWCYFGPEFADEIISGIDNDENRSLTWWLDRGKTVLARRYAMSFPFFKIDNFNLPDVLKGFTDMVAIHERAIAEANAKTGVEENIAAVINAISWTVGRRQQTSVVAGTVLQDYTGIAVEPRANEMFDLAGGSVPKKLEAVKTKTLPAPRSKQKNEDAK